MKVPPNLGPQAGPSLARRPLGTPWSGAPSGPRARGGPALGPRVAASGASAPSAVYSEWRLLLLASSPWGGEESGGVPPRPLRSEALGGGGAPPRTSSWGLSPAEERRCEVALKATECLRRSGPRRGPRPEARCCAHQLRPLGLN